MSELKPCPFCGSDEAFVVNHENHFSVVCGNMFSCCCVLGQDFIRNKQGMIESFGFFASKQDAIKAWNRRAATNLKGQLE